MPDRPVTGVPEAGPAGTARLMWTLFEPIHAISYFAVEARQAFEQGGVRGYWRGYFSGRAAPLGRVDAAPVIATFFSFAPAMVSRACPGIWQLITPSGALAVRQAGAVAALSRLLGDAGVPASAAAAAADRLADIAGALDPAGHPLGAANLALPVPDEPVARLWHAATVLREHRGDGHVAALVAAGVDGVEALVLRVGSDATASSNGQSSTGLTRERLQPLRGWTDAEWDAAAARLTGRGLLEPDGAATAAGAELYRRVEDATDEAAARPWSRLDGAAAAELAAALRPIARACAAVVSFPSRSGASGTPGN